MSETKLNAGNLTKRVSILQPTSAKTVGGFPRNTFTKLIEISAKVDYKSGRETENLTKETGIANVNFIVSRRTDLTKAHKVSYKNKLFNILAILPILKPRKLYIEIVTEQIEITSGDTAGAAQAESKWIDNDGNTWIWN